MQHLISGADIAAVERYVECLWQQCQESFKQDPSKRLQLYNRCANELKRKENVDVYTSCSCCRLEIETYAVLQVFNSVFCKNSLLLDLCVVVEFSAMDSFWCHASEREAQSIVLEPRTPAQRLLFDSIVLIMSFRLDRKNCSLLVRLDEAPRVRMANDMPANALARLSTHEPAGVGSFGQKSFAAVEACAPMKKNVAIEENKARFCVALRVQCNP